MKDTEVSRQFKATVRSHLDAHASDLVAVLGKLIQHPFVPEVRCVDFEVFCDGFTSGFPVRAFFLDEDNTEYFVDVGGEPTYPCSVPPELLEIDGIYPQEVEERVYAVDPDLDYMTLAGQVAVAWFAECWKQAGGLQFPLRATIGLHDDSPRFDLVRQAWTLA